jgi:hypothetical protein
MKRLLITAPLDDVQVSMGHHSQILAPCSLLPKQLCLFHPYRRCPASFFGQLFQLKCWYYCVFCRACTGVDMHYCAANSALTILLDKKGWPP